MKKVIGGIIDDWVPVLEVIVVILIVLCLVDKVADVALDAYIRHYVPEAMETETSFLAWCQKRIDQISSHQGGGDGEMMSLLNTIVIRQEIACRKDNIASTECQEARQCLVLAQRVWGATGSHGK